MKIKTALGKAFYGPKKRQFDQTLYEWFSSKRLEGLTISGPMLIDKAKAHYTEKNMKTNMKFNEVRLRRFKSRRGIGQLKISSEHIVEASSKLWWTLI